MDKEIIIAIIGLLAAATTTTIIIVKIRVKSSKDVAKTVQKNNIVHGDQAGRDINK